MDGIWLSVYPSRVADGGYDVIDYRDVDPRLGTMDDFDAMAAAAHEAGMKVIVDIVPNHTSDGHVWFQEALAAEPGSPARDRYIFRDGLGEHGELPPNDWQSIFGGGAWERVPDGQWYLHMFAKEQPDLTGRTEVHEEFKKTLRFWSDHGADGFRIDVAHGLAKDLDSAPLTELALKGNPLEGLCHDGTNPLWDRPEVHDIYREWREVFNEYDPPRFGRRRGLGGARAPASVRLRGGAGAGVQLRVRQGRLVRRGLPHRHPRRLGIRRGIRLHNHLGDEQP